jgi:2,3-bisphosphoglycerate-dependent phosphoglycerate mutase
MATLALLRHGQSEWNLANLFTGWVDVDLSPQGEKEARAAGRRMREEGIEPGVLHTSVQRRAIRTAELALEELGTTDHDLPVTRSWRLNERHYGALQGLDKAETARRYGDDQVKIWRRSYATRPPQLSDEAWRAQRADPLYADVPDDSLPRGESLADVVERMLPYWRERIVPDVEAGRVAFVVAHGNSLRALVMHLDGLSEDEVLELNIPTGVPLVYELGDDLAPRGSRYLGD